MLKCRTHSEFACALFKSTHEKPEIQFLPFFLFETMSMGEKSKQLLLLPSKIVYENDLV